MNDSRFREWLRELKHDVIQDEYGFEEGEFTVYPDHWEPLFCEGLTPQQAFRRALDARADAQKQEEAERKANWERIKREDAALIAALAPKAQDQEAGHG